MASMDNLITAEFGVHKKNDSKNKNFKYKF